MLLINNNESLSCVELQHLVTRGPQLHTTMSVLIDYIISDGVGLPEKLMNGELKVVSYSH